MRNIMNKKTLNYSTDIVICLDTTKTMAPCIEEIKTNALSFYQQYVDEMAANLKTVQEVRIKIITFKNCNIDLEPIKESRFYNLETETEEFFEYINNINASGGNCSFNNSLEALALAIKSKWNQKGEIRRHVIMMCTDSSAEALGYNEKSNYYPAGMPSSFAELHEWWEDDQKMERRAKRLLIFAPDTDPWSAMIDWSNTFHTPSQAGKGCEEVDFADCIHLLVNSI